MAYPSSLDNFTRRSDGQTIYGAHVNELQAAIEAIEAELGLSPSGSDRPSRSALPPSLRRWLRR